MINNTQARRIGILYGGMSSEHDVSVASGATIKEHLKESNHEIVDVFIDRDGQWHVYGDVLHVSELKDKIDVAFSVLHGAWGESGDVQKLLEYYEIPYTGSDVVSSALSFDKVLTKKFVGARGIKTPRYDIIREIPADMTQKAQELLEIFSQGCVIKPRKDGSSFGISLCRNLEEIKCALEKVFRITEDVFVEELIEGREFTCGVLEHAAVVESLPIVEIVPDASQPFFDFEAKYDGKVQEICPAHITQHAIAHQIQETAKRVHTLLGLSDFSRSDFLCDKDGTVYFLEVNTLPGMTQTSLYPQELFAAGYSLRSFLDIIISKY